jgi:hypothetical protein
MNKFISLLTILILTSPAFANEYKSDNYERYGYAAGASTINDTELKGGLRGAHVAISYHTENLYYPGHLAIPSQKDK